MIRTGGEGKWADLGDMSAACITSISSCSDGGKLMVWIKRLEDVERGVLSSITMLNRDKSLGFNSG